MKSLETIRRTFQVIRGWRALLVMVVFAIALSSVAISTTDVFAKHGGVEVWPAYYEDGDVSVLMYPVGHKKSNPKFPSGCWSASPDVDQAQAPGADFYALFIGAATQMYCPDGSATHDMVATAAPGDTDYSAKINLIACWEGPNYVEGTTYKSEAAVLAGIANEELAGSTGTGPCVSAGARISPVVLGP